LRAIFPDAGYACSLETIDLTSYLLTEFRSFQEREEIIPEQKTTAGLKKTSVQPAAQKGV
jgi:hypothetical protein